MREYIDIELYKTRDNDRDKLNVFEMPDRIRDYYFTLYSYYSQMFIHYLKKKTKINEYDKDISNSELNFQKIEREDKDFYQLLSSGLDYYYLRNNLYLYRLTDEEHEFLKNCLINNKYELDEELENFIENTFRKVMFENVENEEIININFGPKESNNFAPSNSIVLGIRYDENNSEINDEEWYNNFKSQKDFLIDNSENLSKNIKEELKCNVSIFEYNDYTIKKKDEVRKNNM